MFFQCRFVVISVTHYINCLTGIRIEVYCNVTLPAESRDERITLHQFIGDGDGMTPKTCVGVEKISSDANAHPQTHF